MGFTSPWHWAIVLIVLVLLFGSKRLPDAARGIGRSLRIFKSEMKEMTGDDKPDAPEAAAQPVPPAQLPAVTVTPPVAVPQQQPASPQAAQIPPATNENPGS